MYRFVIFLVLFFCGSAFVFPQQGDMNAELKKASSITNSNERLSAYDSILEKYGIKNKVTTTGDKGKWTATVKTDPLDGSKIITFVLIADSGKSRFGDRIALVIRWTDGKNELYINWNDYLGSSTRVTTKLDEGDSETKSWDLSTDSTASFYPGNPTSFIKSLINTKQLIARVTPYNESPSTAIFNLTGLKIVAEQYNNDLKWF